MKFTALCFALASLSSASFAAEPYKGPPLADNRPDQSITLARLTQPSYPVAAMRFCASGKVVVRVRVDELGRTRKAKLEVSSGNEDLDEAAVEAARASLFNPAVVNGVPTEDEARVPFVFHDPCEMELPLGDPRMKALLPPNGWDPKVSPAGWEPYEDVSGRTAHPPQYPKSARRECVGGVVKLRVLVSVEGNIKSISVDTSSGNAALDAAALDAARNWTYRPGRRGDKVVGGDVIVPVHFEAPC